MTCESPLQPKLKSAVTGQRSTKQCSKCKKHLSLNSFSPSSGGKYLRPECRDCARHLSKVRQELKKRFGQPPLNYSCPICLKTHEELQGSGGNAGVWVVDHDHMTDTFRGHLCHNCNRGIGVFQDDINRLLRAVTYLNYGNQI
jgi:DNA-directed RNA polymerase subunit RPC12/RpoP